jgi:uncharacterized protein YdeI (YjbR/CyaY-like superfamily)
MNPKVDEFFRRAEMWRKEMEALRSICLDRGLTEELKWRQPCYTVENNNVVIIGAFKANCALSFFKGALLRDAKGILEKPGENTRAGRLIRFASVRDIMALKPVLNAYIDEAIEIEKAGSKVNFEMDREAAIPEEVDRKLNEDAALKSAFDALTPGRRRAYLLHFSAPKQAKTREARVQKCAERILAGKGLNDCVCGHSKKLPYCDGSHKHYR